MFTYSLIARLKQESCETFVITGGKFTKGDKHSDVIESYHFEYDNTNLPHILHSTKVDVVIFTGALDSKFSWKSQSDAVSYISGLYNLVMSASKAGVKRFIYISTTEVYQQAEGIIDENSPVTGNDLRAETIKNGEELLLQFNQSNGMQGIILRCSEIYGFYNNAINNHSFCSNISSEIIKGNTVCVNQYKKHDNIHVSDAVDAVYKAMKTEEIPHPIYNICSGFGISEKLTVWMISEILGKEAKVKYFDEFTPKHSEFSCELAQNELGFKISNSFDEGFIQFVKNLKDSECLELTPQKKRRLFKRFRKNIESILGWFFPYFETIATFVVVQVIITLTSDFAYLNAVDFYLLYVVFIAIIYGKGHTITALLLCLAGKIHLLGEYDSLSTIVVDYNIYLWLLQLLIIGMGIGYIRDNYKQSIGDNKEEIFYLNEELSEVKEINESNIRIKQIYENRLINYQDSFAKIYSIISKLDDLEPDKIMFAAVDVVSQIMKSNEIAIYSVDKGSVYARLTASSSNIKLAMKKSIQLDPFQELYEEIQNKKIYVNRSFDLELPSMAGGVFHNDVLESIVIIRSLPFENTTLYHMNLFSVVLNLIAQALHRANYHIEENKGNRYIPDTNILTKKSFKKILDIKKQGLDENLAEFCILEITNKEFSFMQISDLVGPTLRQKDYIGLGENDKLYLLLTNTNESEAEYVIKRLAMKGIETRKEVLGGNGNKDNSIFRAC